MSQDFVLEALNHYSQELLKEAAALNHYSKELLKELIGKDAIDLKGLGVN